jgi:hypothetical protein
MDDRKTFPEILKAELIEWVSLFFAPVTAVAREFVRAVDGTGHAPASMTERKKSAAS